MAEIFGSDIPNSIYVEDKLGREEYSEKDAKHALRNQNMKIRKGPRVREFLPSNNSNEI